MHKILLSAAILLGSASLSAADNFKVVTTFTIIQDMAQNIGGEHAEVVSITRPNSEIHGYQPTPGDIMRAQDGDLIFWNGLGLELWFEKFFQNLQDVPSVVVSEGVEALPIKSGNYEGRPNPHAWMSPSNAAIYIDNMLAAFVKYDPEHKDYYEANAADYKAQIEASIEPLREQLNSVSEYKKWLVSCEGAFSYLANDFGLQELYLWPINSDGQGTPQQIKSVIDTVRENNIPAVFCESTVSQDPAFQVAKETNAKYGGVLYVDSLTDENGPVPSYLDLLDVTARTIVSGLMDE